MPDKSKKINALESYVKVMNKLLPLEEEINAFHLWHNDLHDDNIFVDPSDPTKITGIIDWQSVEVGPLMDVSPDLPFLGYNGPEPEKLDRPVWPDTSGLSKEEEDRVIEQHEIHSVFIGFRMLLQKKTPALHKAIMFQRTEANRILLISRRIFEVGEAYLHSCLADLQEHWAELPSVKGHLSEKSHFPLGLTQSELKQIEEDVNASEKSIEMMNSLKNELGAQWPDKGATSHEQYAEVKRKLRALKADIISQYSRSDEDRKLWEEYWPFDD